MTGAGLRNGEHHILLCVTGCWWLVLPTVFCVLSAVEATLRTCVFSLCFLFSTQVLFPDIVLQAYSMFCFCSALYLTASPHMQKTTYCVVPTSRGEICQLCDKCHMYESIWTKWKLNLPAIVLQRIAPTDVCAHWIVSQTYKTSQWPPKMCGTMQDLNIILLIAVVSNRMWWFIVCRSQSESAFRLCSFCLSDSYM